MEDTVTSRIKINDEQPCYEVRGDDVEIYIEGSGQRHGSSRVKLKNIVDFKWEMKNYPGRLIAVHLNRVFVAYSIKVNAKGMVRVLNTMTGKRALMKNMQSEILDIQFAHMTSQVLLAFCDASALYIYRIEEEVANSLLTTLLLKVDNTQDFQIDDRMYDSVLLDRISWCPAVIQPKGEDDDYASQLLVWTLGATFQCFSVNTIIESQGGGSYYLADLDKGILQFTENTQRITCATFSPDGTTLAVGNDNGNVYFYQIYLYLEDPMPRRLHQWTPHEAQPISSLIFLDNHAVDDGGGQGNAFWVYALTATRNNTEIKLWRCDNWSCIQRIQFKANFEKTLYFKMEIDQSSQYLVLSEQNQRVLYAMQIQQLEGQHKAAEDDDDEESSKKEADDSKAITEAQSNDSKTERTENGHTAAVKNSVSTVAIRSIAQFPMSSAILSFNVASVEKRQYKNDDLLDDLDDLDEDVAKSNDSFVERVYINMFVVQPKSVQECHVLFQADKPTKPESVFRSSSSLLARAADTFAILNSPNNNGGSSSHNTSSGSNINNTAAMRQKSSAQLNLMTPESFQSPGAGGKESPENVSKDVLSTIRMLAASATSPDQKDMLRKSMDLINNAVSSPLATTDTLGAVSGSGLVNNASQNNAGILPSGNSSPSREVQEILSLKDEMFENIQSNDLTLDEELAANCPSSMGGADGEDVSSDNSNMKVQAVGAGASKGKVGSIIDDINAINVYVDDEDEDNVAECPAWNVTDSDWPKVPNILPNVVHLEQQQQKTAPLINGAADVPNNFNNLNMAAVAASTSAADHGNKLDKVLELLQVQSQQIQQLQLELAGWKQQYGSLANKHASPDHMKATTVLQMAELSKGLDDHLSRCEQLISYELDQVTKKQAKQFNAFKESLQASLTKMIAAQFSDKMSTVFFGDLQRNLLGLMAKEMEIVKHQIHHDVSRNLAVSDQLLRENLMVVCSNKSLLETFANSVRAGVHQTVHNVFTEQVTKAIIPAYERASKEIFKQMNETFQKGVTSYSKQVHSYMTQFQPVHEQNEQILVTMKALPEQFKVSNEKVINSFSAQIIHEVNKDFKTLQINVLKLLKDSIKTEISKGFESQVANLEDSVLSVVRSQAQTPSVFDIQEQIRQLLNQGQINKAFHQALISNDLALVEFALEKADISTVFNPCHLEQTVLLSLIQQLSADMNNYNELKNKWLGEAIMSLNLRDPLTREHAPKILKQLCKNCHAYMEENPHGQLSSRVKMLLMVIQGLSISSPSSF